MEKIVFILIDFDNVFKKPLNQYTIVEFQLNLNDIVKSVLSLNTSPTEIKIRFYGGWFRDDNLSTVASLLQQKLALISLFPIIREKKIIRGSMELATSMFSFPSHIWTNTYKEKEGIARLRVNEDVLPEWCNLNKTDCPAFMLSKFTSKKAKQCHHQHCDIKNSVAFTGIEQKMVDTMIACDLISFSQFNDVEAVCLFSDDLDLLPPLGFTSIFRNDPNSNFKVQLFVKNERQINLIKQILPLSRKSSVG